MPDKSLARNLTPRPGGLAQMAAPEQKGLWSMLEQALQGYWDRQGKLAQEGLTMADQGARQMREGDPTGALGMVGGPLSYLMSPVSALVPTGEEIDTARDLPEWSKPLARAASHTALLALPGPDLGPVASSVGNTARRIGDDAAIAFGAEVPEGVTVYGAGPILKKPGLGRGMANLAGDATDAELAALKARLEAEAAQTGTGAAPATRDQALLNLTGGGAGQTPGPAQTAPPIKSFAPKPPEGITAYHASPHKFDKFDMSKIGTGEGAQTYGHGLYFAEHPAVSGRGGEYDRQFTRNMRESAGVPKAADYAEFMLEKHQGNRPAAIAEMEATIANLPERGREKMYFFQHQMDAINLLKSGTPLDLPRANIYQVRINAKPDEFLDWDAPLSQQPAQVRSALTDMMGRTPPVDHPGSTVYNRISEELGGARGIPNEQMTEALKARGIKGIRYLDQGSRGPVIPKSASPGLAGKMSAEMEGVKPTYNYVVFDDKIIDILKRYGIPMTVGAGGAMVVSGQNMPPDLAAQMGGGVS